MKKVMQIFICSILGFCLLLPVSAKTGPAEDFQEARLLYLTAVASFASYPGADGDIAASVMRSDGWLTIPYIEKDANAQANFLLAWKGGQAMPSTYLLAIAGTHNVEGMKLVFRAGKVYFAGTTIDEFAANADRKDNLSNQALLVHKGFHQYVQTTLATEVQPPAVETPGRKLHELLLTHPDWKVYLTGHSSGGSAATLLGARLISLGVNPEQLKIVTFAAPAVGNEVFAKKYAPVLNLVRVVVAGDPIPEALQRIAGGFSQFGREVVWKIDGHTIDEKHYPYIYLDCAIKYYYDKRLAAEREGVPAASVPAGTLAKDGKRLYIAAIKNDLPRHLTGEFKYMREVLLDQYRDSVPAYVIGGSGLIDADQFETLRLEAAKAGCDRMVIAKIWGEKQEDPAKYSGGLMSKPDEAYDLVVIEQAVFRVSDGVLLDGRTYEKGSKYFTALGALLSAAVAMGSESAAWSGQRIR